MASEMQPQSQQHIEIEHPPHILRLLRLIREGTPSHASRASTLLGRYAASCSSGITHDDASEDTKPSAVKSDDHPIHPSLIIWDLIGRLVAGDGKSKRKKRGDATTSSSSGLFDFHWETRTNCALALETVARCLPVEDRRHFFEGDDNNAAADESLLWLSVHDLRAKFDDSEDEEDTANHLSKKQCAEAKTKKQLPTEEGRKSPRNQMQLVLERGRLLLASSGERYDWTCEDEEAQAYIKENQALQSLDGAAAYIEAKSNQGSNDTAQSFLQRRIALQRHILARRIGLGGILSSAIVNLDGNPAQQEIVNDEELVSDLTAAATSGKKRKGTKQSGKKGKGAMKRKRKATKKDQDEDDEFLPTIDIRQLLISESNQSNTTDSPNNKQQRQSGHRNPQLLLSTEVTYRTFDPQWTVRHGALVATLSLLRAWRVHDSSHGKTTFGKWPQDILARCICIIGLDRFADFSGVDIEPPEKTHDVISGAIIAPVREMAAQIIAILLEAAPSDVWDCTFDLLYQLFYHRCGNERDGWEVRHGVLLVWKYVCALAGLHSGSPTEHCIADPSFRPLTRRSHSSYLIKRQSTFDKIIKLSVQGISDESDDVRAVSAQVLLQMLKMNQTHYTVDIVKEYSCSIWNALCSTRNDVSSSAADLLILFATVLSSDLHSTIQSLRNEQLKHDTDMISSILSKLASFIRFDSAVVRISCFQALRLGTDSVTDEAYISSMSELSSTVRVMCDIVERLFYHVCEHSLEGTVGNQSEEAWVSIVNALAHLTGRSNFDDECQKTIHDAAVTITLRYFGISKQELLSSSETSIELMFRGIEAVSDGLIREMSTPETDSFVLKSASSTALVQFYKKVCPCKLNPILSLAICTCLQSPWPDQCEAGCLLFVAIVSVDNFANDGCLLDFVQASKFDNLISQTPLSILIGGSSLGDSLLRDLKLQSFCDDAFSTALTSEIGSPKDTNQSVLSDNIVAIWKSVFKERGVSFDALMKSSKSTKSSVRLNASIAGAAVLSGYAHWPKKITPIVQALMTSLKNEDSEPRAKQTCYYIARMIAMIPADSFYIKARNKLLENICVLASDLCTETREPPPSTLWARHTIGLIVANLSSDKELEHFPVIFDMLSLLKDPSYSTLSDQQQFESVLMLRIVTATINEPGSLVQSFTEPALHIVCSNQSAFVRNQVSESILNLCTGDFSATMDAVINFLMPILTNLEDDNGRAGGCELLLTILQKCSVSASPYVITLLPVVMRLMTDVLEECSRLAASAFAILVRIAPLSANSIDQSGSRSASKVSKDVIKHLILGKPLPPCKLPSEISRALKESGTVLRPYQMEGISWMRFLSEVHLNGALCDDMGLGKTLQSLVAVAMSHCSETGESSSPKKSLVVCPSTVVGHWVREICRFFPRSQVLSPFEFIGPAKERKNSWKAKAHKHNIVVTSYSVLRSDVGLLEQTIWDYCILDEGHLLKNPKTITAKASRRIKAHHKLILTGTPIQNNVNEIWATFDFLMPNFLGHESNFIKEFAKPIVNGQKLEASAADMNRGMDCLKILHQQVLPFVLRREKGQVMKELPPKIITDIPCTLSRQQHALYEQVMAQSHTKAAVDAVDKSIKNTLNAQTDSLEPQKLGSNVLARLLHLRLICTHPSLYALLESNEEELMSLVATRLDASGKLMALNDLLRHSGVAESEITAADNDSSAFIINANQDLSDTDDDILVNGDSINDSVECDVDGDDAKPDEASKCLIFAQFTQSLDIVEKFLFEPHMPSLEYLRLDGRVPSGQRGEIVDRFNEDRNIKVLLLTTKIGGLGLNLTGADKVIFLEPDWNPFIDLQAMDRAHRIGQTKTVNVYRLITTDTIEEKMLKLQDRKRATADAVVNTENSTMYSMGTDKLLDIFSFRGTSDSANSGSDDNVLSYLDDSESKEYASLSVGGFLGGLK